MFSKQERSDVSAQANASGFEPAVILGFTQVESAGRSYWNVNGQRKPAIRPEGHYFYRLLEKTDKTLLKRAVNLHLASPKVGGVKVPRNYADVYSMFAQMIDIHPECAYQSISMGVGQVMGEHYKKLGYSSAEAMFSSCSASLRGQVEVMLRFIKRDKKLTNALRDDDYKTAARIYNGPKYAMNQYDTKLKSAVAYYRREEGAKTPEQIDEDRIRNLGYDKTRDFQEAHGLKPDGDIGPMTTDAINEIEAGRKKPEQNGTNAALGGGGIIATVLALQSQLTELLPVLEIFKEIGTYGPMVAATLIGALIVGGGVYAFYKFRHRDALA